MGLLATLKLPPPRKLAQAKPAPTPATKAVEAELLSFGKEAKRLADEGHPEGESLWESFLQAGKALKKGLVEEVSAQLAPAQKKLKAAKQVATGDFAPEGKAASEVEPGAAEQSLKEFAAELKSVIGWIGKAQSAVKKVDDWTGAKEAPGALAKTAEALGKVAEGLGKVGAAAGKLLAVAEVVHKIQRCRDVIAAAQAADFEKDPQGAAKAMGELVRVFGELGSAAVGEVPLLKGYFSLIQRLGEIWVPFANMVVRRKQEAMDASDDRDRPVAPPPPPKSSQADDSRMVALADLYDYLLEMNQVLDKSDEGDSISRAKKIYDSGSFGFKFHHDRLLQLRAQVKGGAIRQFLHVEASLNVTERKWLVESWSECLRMATELQKALGNWAFIGITYVPVIRTLEREKPAEA